MKRLWHRFLAYWRLDLKLVCELSEGLDMDADYHDYTDTADKIPRHFMRHKCARCRKEFFI